MFCCDIHHDIQRHVDISLGRLALIVRCPRTSNTLRNSQVGCIRWLWWRSLRASRLYLMAQQVVLDGTALPVGTAFVISKARVRKRKTCTLVLKPWDIPWGMPWDRPGDEPWYTTSYTLRYTLRCTVKFTRGNTLRCTLGNTLRYTLRCTLGNTLRYTLKYTLRNTLGYNLRYTLRCTLGNTLRYTLRYAMEFTMGSTTALEQPLEHTHTAWDNKGVCALWIHHGCGAHLYFFISPSFLPLPQLTKSKLRLGCRSLV